MRGATWMAIPMVMAVACSGGSNPNANHSPLPTVSASSHPSASPLPIAAAYGLLIVNGRLEMITPDGQVGASVPIALPTLQNCSPGLSAWLQPPVSATSDKVFYRDGDAKIRYVTPTGETGDATTVPGDASKVSFFSVSPDDRRIAVLVEDFSGTSIALRLYVEDVSGGGNHKDIYSTSTPRSESATTLWPMGWRQGNLVLAQIKGCTNTPYLYAPSEWHVSDPSTGNRVATIMNLGLPLPIDQGGATVKPRCNLSFWPSPAGVTCVDGANGLILDWTGKRTSVVKAGESYQETWGTTSSGLSPNGQRAFFATRGVCAPAQDRPAFWTNVQSDLSRGGTTYSALEFVTGACLWIDDDHLLSADGVLNLAPEKLVRKRLPQAGICAGRYPAGL
jgi:hypothetical protein